MNEPLNVMIEFPQEDGASMSADLVRLDRNLYRIESVVFAAEGASYGDIIEAVEIGPNELRFVRVVESGGWTVDQYLIRDEEWDSERIKNMRKAAERIGGHWERIFGGLLYICTPPGKKLKMDEASQQEEEAEGQL